MSVITVVAKQRSGRQTTWECAPSEELPIAERLELARNTVSNEINGSLTDPNGDGKGDFDYTIRVLALVPK